MQEITTLQINDFTTIPMEEAVEMKGLFTAALKNYAKSGMTPNEWSRAYFKASFPEKNDEEINQWVNEIDSTLTGIETKKASIANARKNGIGVDDWFANDMRSATSQMSTQEAATYFSNLDTAVRDMNQTWAEAVMTNSGTVSQNPHLDGFIAEAHHVKTFNADAVARGSQYRAEMLTPESGSSYSKNSVDIVIKDGNGKIVRRYQSKYGRDSRATEELFAKGDYRGQQKLIPEGQDIAKKSTDRIQMDGVESKPLSKTGAKQKQEEVQKSGKAPVEDYNAFETKTLFKSIGQNIAVAGVWGAGMGAAFEIGSKLVQGEDVELEDIAVAAIKGGAENGVKTAAASAIKVGIEKGVLPFGKATPLGAIVATVDAGISNIETMFKMGSGEMGVQEGINEIETNTLAAVGGYFGAMEGASLGAAVGSMIPVVGTAVGALIGGMVGGFAGTSVGKVVAKGFQAVREAACKIGKAVVGGVADVVSGIWDCIFG